MKKNIIVLGAAVLLAACGGEDKKKKEFQYNRVQKTETKKVVATEKAPIDMDNEGIGPIKGFSFPETTDSDLAKKGEAAFKQKCTACHYPNKRLIGPAMKGIYERRSPSWVMNMLLNPTEMLEKDPIAKALLKEYNNTIMLNQNLSEEEARSIAEYLRTL